jgi:hypothetical protein
MSPLKIALAAIMPVVLTACVGATTIYYSDNTTRFYPEFVRYASATGEMAIEIYGNPFGTSGSTNAAAIAAVLDMPPDYGDARFTTTPKPNLAKQRVVIVFNPVHPSPGGNAVCSDPAAIALAPPADPMRVEMALCSSEDWVSQATIVGPRGMNINDPMFRKTIGDGLQELMPYLNRAQTDGCGNDAC